MTPKDAMRWIQSHLGFINRLPSWLNELLSGFLCVGLAYGLTSLIGAPRFTFPLAFVLSEIYEHVFDPWGYSSSDVVERARGIILLLVLALSWPALRVVLL